MVLYPFFPCPNFPNYSAEELSKKASVITDKWTGYTPPLKNITFLYFFP